MLSNYLVKKPWGSEYLIYSNKKLAAWLLEMKFKSKTSLHCHPKKKTGLILIKGSAEIDIGFYEKIKIKAPAKIMIRPGLFHATKSTSKKGSILIELETPVDKNDLVRFQDQYGRSHKPYESKKQMIKLPKEKILFKNPDKIRTQKYNFSETTAILKTIKSLNNLKFFKKKDIIAVLNGGLDDRKNRYVLSPGDIIRVDTIKKLASEFNIKDRLTFLRIRKNAK